MSLSGAIYIGVSGLDAYTQGLQAVSNNVANLNTAGYKETTTSFIDMFGPGGNGADPSGADGQADGNGVRVAPSQLDFTQGTLQQTGGALDMAIQGNGFLVLLDGTNQVYARTGSFGLDSNGFIAEQGTSLKLGVLNGSNQPEPFNVGGLKTDAAVSTSSVTFADNLSSAVTTDTVSGVNVFDATGAQHNWQVGLSAVTGTPGAWNVTITDENGATIGSGKLTFTGGAIDPATAKIVVDTTVGGQPLSVTLNFSNVTSFSSGSSSTLQVGQSDGHAAGSLTSVTVNSSGQLVLNYSNNQTKTEGSVAMANFLDPQQLQEAANGTFTNPKNEPAEILGSGQGGMGTLVSQQLEGSNVNLTQEFGDLILIQRGFQASSQVVSVANDMIQELFGIRGQG